MGFHPGRVSLGCVTVTTATTNQSEYNADPTWGTIRAVLDRGSYTYKGSEYSGFLWVHQ